MNVEAFSKYLKKLRGSYSIRYVAEKTGISNAYLSQLESGKRDNPHPDILKKLAKFYNIPVLELLKNAGYLDEDTGEESYEQKINIKYLQVINDPKFSFGSRLNEKDYDLDTKRFIVEMYEELTGNKILDRSKKQRRKKS